MKTLLTKKTLNVFFLLSLLLLIPGCTSVFGPLKAEEGDGEKGSPDMWLARAETLYMGATGTEEEIKEKLQSAFNIYDSLINRDDLEEAQIAEAVRGYCRCFVELNTEIDGDVLVDAYDIFQSFDQDTLTLSSSKTNGFVDRMGSTASLNTVINKYITEIDNKTEGDYVYIGVMSVLLLSRDTVEYFINTSGLSQQLNSLEPQLNELESNVIIYSNHMLSATNFTPAPDQEWTNELESYSNAIVSNTNTIYSTIVDVTNFIPDTRTFITSIDTTTVRYNTSTAEADNFINENLGMIFDMLSESITEITNAFGLYEDTGDNILNSPF